MDVLAFVFTLGLLSISVSDHGISVSLEAPPVMEEPAAQSLQPPMEERTRRIRLTNRLFRDLRTARLEYRAPGPVQIARR